MTSPVTTTIDVRATKLSYYIVLDIRHKNQINSFADGLCPMTRHSIVVYLEKAIKITMETKSTYRITNQKPETKIAALRPAEVYSIIVIGFLMYTVYIVIEGVEDLK